MEREHRFKKRFMEMRMDENWQRRQRVGKITAGIFVIAAGVLVLIGQMGVPLPHWLLSWKMILIAAGVVNLIKHQFRHLAGYIMVTIGGTFMLSEMMPNMFNPQFLWPVLIIFIGASMIAKSIFGGRKKKFWEETVSSNELDDSDFIEANAYFGGVTKKIVSKNLRGASVSAVFGGTEINLMQADFEKETNVEVTCVFGGVTLIVPSDWKLVSEATTVFGGIDDQRHPSNPELIENQKTIRLKGNCVFGGIELHSYDKSASKNW